MHLGDGRGYAYTAGQIVASLGGEPDGQDVFISLFSITNALSRLAFGYLPERLLHINGTPRWMSCFIRSRRVTVSGSSQNAATVACPMRSRLGRLRPQQWTPIGYVLCAGLMLLYGTVKHLPLCQQRHQGE